jgi:transposase
MTVPHGHAKTTAVTAAPRTSGPTAIALFDGATIWQRFRAYVTDTLVPRLNRGDPVILDHRSVHRVAGVRKAIAAAGARIRCLPAYPPDFNPIVQAFAKRKARLRAAAARTGPDLWATIRKAFTRFTSEVGHNGLVAADYDTDLAVATCTGTALGSGDQWRRHLSPGPEPVLGARRLPAAHRWRRRRSGPPAPRMPPPPAQAQ